MIHDLSAEEIARIFNDFRRDHPEVTISDVDLLTSSLAAYKREVGSKARNPAPLVSMQDAKRTQPVDFFSRNFTDKAIRSNKFQHHRLMPYLDTSGLPVFPRAENSELRQPVIDSFDHFLDDTIQIIADHLSELQQA